MSARTHPDPAFRAADSFYAATAHPWAGAPALAGDTTCEVAVIGGGFAGLWCARRLAAQGKQVLLLEGGEIGRAASGRNGGFVSVGFAAGLDEIERKLGRDDARALFRLSDAGRQTVRDFCRETPDLGIAPVDGRLKVLRHADDGALKARVETLNAELGQDMVYWPRDKVRDHLKTDTYHEAMEDRQGFHVHPLNLARALAADCVARGVTVHEHSPVTALDRDDTGWKITTPGGTVRASQVVLAGNVAAGGEGASVWPALSRAIVPVATYVVTTERMGAKLHDAIRWSGSVSDTRRAGDYYRIVDGDRLLWGGRITTRVSEPTDLAETMRADIERIYPQLAPVKIAHVWTGLMGYCRHKMPILGELAPGLWACTAFGGHGLNTTATGGEAVADAIVGTDDRVKLFAPYRALWGGGPVGRIATQLEYWRLQALDWLEERRAA
ncbi:NAD(P)/FAD-dependent oxidoreductase [Tepidamorphus sp. 3E244]|uniref:NAD(P)/FAD-dependent oxidoreductase n=1 Tax=Tepidamorphus sp. 3E244 TaxID=3385498 RepID=UPI0038FCA521